MMPGDNEPLHRWEIVAVALVMALTAVLGAGVARAMIAVGTWVYRGLT